MIDYSLLIRFGKILGKGTHFKSTWEDYFWKQDHQHHKHHQHQQTHTQQELIGTLKEL